MADRNHVELDWAVDAITVGARHRKDMGDLQPLADSIEQYGLLQPLTITDQGVLVCGARRLAAIKSLGWRQVNVWVRVGLSDKLSAIMAERDENICHKAFTKLELADLYEEMKTEIAADAARRQQSTHFGPGGVQPDESGAAKLAAPWQGRYDSRRQAAAMVGGASHMTMEKIAAIRETAADVTRPDTIRDQAADALRQLEAGQPVDSLFHALRCQIRIDDLEQIANNPHETNEARDKARQGAILLRKLEDTDMGHADLDKAARAALDRVKAAQTRKPAATARPNTAPAAPRLRTVKSFTWTWNEMRNWPAEYDPQQIADELTDQQWEQFKTTITASVAFMEQVEQLRQTT